MRIIACGNPDRRDDAAGLLVAERLHALGIEVLIEAGNALGLIHAWTGVDDVVIVDAVVSGAPPGSLHVWDAGNSSPQVGSLASSHGFGVAEAIELGRALGCVPRRLRVFGIEGREFGFGFQVSPELMPAVDRAVAEIHAMVDRTRQNGNIRDQRPGVGS